MSTDNTIVSTIEELEQFIDIHENCVMYATKELVNKLNRNMAVARNASSEQIDLFFKIYEWIDIMAAKNIGFEVEQ